MARSFWRRLLGLGDRAGAEAALRALVAAQAPHGPDRAAVSALFEAYGLSGPAVRTVCSAVFASAVARALDNAAMDDTEMAALTRLKAALSLSEREARAVCEAAAETPVKRAVNAAMRDAQMDTDERERLRALARQLLVSDATLTRWVQESAQPIFQRRLDALLDDRRYSPDDESELQALAASLGGAITVARESQPLLDRYRLLWQIDNGLLPIVDAPIALQRGEVCHASVAVRWLEPRTVTTSVSYAGLTGSVRIAKGIRFRVGNFVPARHTEDRLTLIDTGDLYITNRRLILRGATRNITVRLSGILSFDVYANGVEVQKSRGRPPFLEIATDDLEVTAAMLSAVLVQAGE